MATLTINFTPPPIPPVDGYIVYYRIKGSSGAYTQYLISGENPTTSPIIITGLASATEYEGTISSACDMGGSGSVTFSTCTCASGFSPSPMTGDCKKVETTTATLDFSDFCLTAATENSYSAYASRIYNVGFSNASINEIVPTIPSDVYVELTTPDIWVRSTPSNGPMNRAGVWLDSNCDGTPDSVVSGTQLTIAAVYNNAGPTKVIYIGVGGDNSFDLVVNEVHVALPPNPVSVLNFNIWHIFPVTVIPGTNLINLKATSAGGVDGVAMVIYDATKEQLAAVTTLPELTAYEYYTTSSLRGAHIDVAYCPSGYGLVTSGGVGSYYCEKTTYLPCGGV